jgi:hypothetical protein
MKFARRSVSDADIRKYQAFAQTLQQVRESGRAGLVLALSLSGVCANAPACVHAAPPTQCNRTGSVHMAWQALGAALVPPLPPFELELGRASFGWRCSHLGPLPLPLLPRGPAPRHWRLALLSASLPSGLVARGVAQLSSAQLSSAHVCLPGCGLLLLRAVSRLWQRLPIPGCAWRRRRPRRRRRASSSRPRRLCLGRRRRRGG